MTHNDFDFYDDLIRPLMQFLVQTNILSSRIMDDSSDDSEHEASGNFLNKTTQNFLSLNKSGLDITVSKKHIK